MGFKVGCSAIFMAKKAQKQSMTGRRFYKRTLDNLDDDFGQVDHDKDSCDWDRFGHLIQMHIDQSLRRAKHCTRIYENFIHPSWKIYKEISCIKHLSSRTAVKHKIFAIFLRYCCKIVRGLCLLRNLGMSPSLVSTKGLRIKIWRKIIINNK